MMEAPTCKSMASYKGNYKNLAMLEAIIIPLLTTLFIAGHGHPNALRQEPQSSVCHPKRNDKLSVFHKDRLGGQENFKVFPVA